MADLPAIEKVVPHAAPMLLLDELVESGEGYLECSTTVRDDGLFADRGRVPALLGIEYMAQAVAAYSGLRSYWCGEPAKLGFLLGTRRFESDGPYFCCGEQIIVRVEQVIQSSGGMAAFDCSLRSEKLTQKARVSVYEPADAKDILEGSGANVG